ncbi:hypothetical protein VCHA57P527_160072 [Vibrio chagasii]|nr:hypothetical protein VCHA57P527_160072 [Vibrio chagasii]
MESQKTRDGWQASSLAKASCAVDSSTHEIIAPELTETNTPKYPEMSGDGAYDTRTCHAAIKIKGPVALILPRKGAAFWKRGHPRNFAEVARSYAA